MSFRTIGITGPAELHVKNGSLVVEKEMKEIMVKTDCAAHDKGVRKRQKKPGTVKVSIPLEDIGSIVCMGAGVRISTMAMAQLCRNKISMKILDEKYRPSGFLNAYEANARQSLTMRRQVFLKTERAETLWRTVVNRKIRNQARVLDILGFDDSEKLCGFASHTQEIPEIDPLEAGVINYKRFLIQSYERQPMAA